MTKPAVPLTTILTFAGILAGTGAGFAQPVSPSSGPTTLTATVRSVDAQARVLEVVTGVGYALRVVKLSFPQPAELKTSRGAAPLTQLKPGDLVRVEYVKNADANTATKIEVLPAPEAGSAR
jgi:hypothetical protein